MVQKIPYHQFTGNTVTLGSSTSRVIMGADSGNLKIQDSQSNTSIIEPGLKDGIIGGGLNATVYSSTDAIPLASTKPVGHLAWATANNSVFVRGETGWYKIATTNESPTITLSATTATIEADNTTLDFTYTTDDDAKITNVTVANSGFATVGNVAITHTTSNNHIRAVFDGTTAYTGATITVTATDGINQASGTMTINTSYSEELHQPSSTTRLLGMTFNSGGLGKTGSWNTPTVTGSPTYNNTGGTLNSGYISGWSSGVYLSPGELASTNSQRNKTFIAWYKGTQSNSSNSSYSPGIPIFGDDSSSVHLGFGLDGGKIAICGGYSATKGTTSLNDGNWRMLAFTCTTGDVAEAYCDVSGTMTKEISNKDIGGNATAYNKVNRIGTGYGYSGMDYPSALDAIQIYSGILTQTQLQAIYNKGK
jgi:hypothetical protein